MTKSPAKKPAPDFTRPLAKAVKLAADAGYHIKFEIIPPEQDNSVTPLEEWKRSRAS